MKKFFKDLSHLILKFLTMPCQQVAMKADLSDISLSDIAKMTLHLVMCKPCSKYVKSNSSLKEAAKHVFRQKDQELQRQVEDLNKKLLQKLGK